MAFLKYSDLPIFADFTSQNSDVKGDASKIFAATEASLSFDANLASNRFLGKIQSKNDFSTTGPLEGKLSFTFYPLIENNSQNILNIQKSNQLAFFDLTGNHSLGHYISFSNFLLKKCYLQSYSIKINPYQPISITSNFISYDVTSVIGSELQSTNTDVIKIAKNQNIPHYEALHALSTKMDGDTTNIPSSKISIDINVDCQRFPIYTLGNKTPDSVILQSAERTTTIQGENIGSVIDISGSNPGATNIYFLPLSDSREPNFQNNVLFFDINGRISSQQLQIAQNSMLNGKVVIKEILL